MKSAIACIAAAALSATTAAAQPADFGAYRRAIEERIEYYASGSVGHPCMRALSSDVAPGFPDTQRGLSPASFRQRPQDARQARIFALLERHGLLERLPGAAPEYGLTWKGYAATSRNAGCVYTGGGEAVATVLSARPASGSTGDVEVTAKARPARLEAWAADAEFAELFDRYSSASDDYREKAWILSPTSGGFEVKRVASSGGDPETLGVPWAVRAFAGLTRRPPPDPADVMQRAGELTAARVMAAIEAADMPPERSRVCFRLSYGGDQPATRESPSIWFFADGRAAIDAERVKLEYEPLRRLVALGILEAQTLPPGVYFGFAQPRGGVRFDLTARGRAMAAADDPTCLVVGRHRVAELLRFERFTAQNMNPAFLVRSQVELLPGREPLVEAFGNLRRLAAVGGGGGGMLAYRDGKLLALGIGFENTEFRADPATAVLPPFPAAR